VTCGCARFPQFFCQFELARSLIRMIGALVDAAEEIVCGNVLRIEAYGFFGGALRIRPLPEIEVSFGDLLLHGA
jgi:hypothetical protein